MDNRELTDIEQAHAAACVALLNAVPTMTEEQANEVVDSLSVLLLQTLNTYVPGDDDAIDYN
jgi:hypothetical protein